MRLTRGNKIAVYAFSDESLPAIDLHKELKKSGRAEITPKGLTVRSPGVSVPLDFHIWLPHAAPHYHISPNFDDYIMVPVIIMPSDLPNRNAVAFPIKELIRFHPHLGQQAYKTWKGKPTHYEHQNDDITKALGVIADAYIRKMKGFGQNKVYKILLLTSFDRSKNPHIVSRIESKDLNTYSMGAFIEGYTCSICSEKLGHCKHLDPNDPIKMYELGDKLVFRNVYGVEGFECSAVESPAYFSAVSDTLIRTK